MPGLNTTLLNKSNVPFNNGLFSIGTIPRMHETAARLYLAAKELRDVEGQSAVARLLNESPQTLRNWEIRGVSSQGAVKAQLAIGCDAAWLLGGVGEMQRKAAGNSGIDVFARPETRTDFHTIRPHKIHVVPVVGQGSAGDMPERVWGDGDFPVGTTNEYAEVASTDPHAFIVRVVGPSMIPRFNPGEYALVEPVSDPDIEDDVLVRLGNGQTMLKRLLSRRGGHVRLGSYNDPAILTFEKSEVTWMYYVAYPVPARKIKSRI